MRCGLLVDDVDPEFRRDLDIRYLVHLGGYLRATLLTFVQPWLTVAVAVAVTALLALLFLLGPAPRASSPD